MDLLGPGSIPNAVTERPADTRVFPSVWSWFKACVGGQPGTGTPITADFLNGVLAQIRRAIQGMGVTIDNADDDMLLKAIQSVAGLSVGAAAARANLPIYPHVTASNGLLGVTGSTGSVVVTAGQTFLHRGLFLVSTDDSLLAARTFATVANKTYHLRWRWNGGTPAFSLQDLSDVVYNPGAAAESAAAFDTALDDMLVARVVTNGSNDPTITMLANRSRDSLLVTRAAALGDGGADSTQNATTVHTINWARTPNYALAGIYPPGANRDTDARVFVSAATRYTVTVKSWSWADAGAPHNSYGYDIRLSV